MARAKKKTKAWFIKVRGSYLPYSWQGWLTYIPFVGFLLFVWLYAMNGDYTASERLFIIFPQWVAAAVVMTWLASQKS